jgi:hypothetical protein
VDQELIEDLSFAAYRRTGIHLEIPAIGQLLDKRQYLAVSAEELDKAVLKDKENGVKSS